MFTSLPSHARDILTQIQRLLPAWQEDVDRRIDILRQEFVVAYPDQVDGVTDLIRKRQPVCALLKAAYKEGAGSPKTSWEELVAQAQSLEVPGLLQLMETQRQNGKRLREKNMLDRQRGSNGGPLSTVKPRANQATVVHPVTNAPTLRQQPTPIGLVYNDIRNLKPHKAWTLLLDETGDNFDESSSGLMGKFVGLLIADPHSGLPPIRAGWHAVDENSVEIDRVCQQILNAPCGVIGLPVSALPKAHGLRWLDGMRALIDWVLRLIPLDGPTHIDVVIEARRPYRPGTEPDAVCRDAVAMLARAWPERAALIELKISTQPKTGHALLPYVDAIAYTWGSPSPASKERLKRSGLVKTCLLNFSSTDLAACWDAWDQPGGLTASYWVALVTSPEASEPASIASAILGALAHATRQDSVRWQRYLAEAQRHLFSGFFQLEQMGAMVNWLAQAMPSDEAIPDTLRLGWLTVNLAHANHLGATENEWLTDLNRLSANLYEEVAPLCCHADLHLAVAMTNRFDFAGAMQAVARWHDRSPEVPGLRYWGQCRSTMGQHFAFVGDPESAQKAFRIWLTITSRYLLAYA
jgi:hypothetical protein